MSNAIENYKQQFKPETVEMIVRISWCFEKGGSKFDLLDNYYKAKAKFDKALLVNTGEVMDVEFSLCWLEWLAPKKLFGFPYGYHFKKGKLYRILAREYCYKEGDKFKKFFIEKLLEEDVKEPRLDPVCLFENAYEQQVKDMTVLVKSKITGWACEAGYRIPKTAIVAAIDHETNEFIQPYGRLTWIEKDSSLPLRHNFEALGVYHVKVRQGKKNKASYLLEDVVKKVKDSRLETIKQEYLLPVVLKNELGEFTLNRNLNSFVGVLEYQGEECDIDMYVEEGETTADGQVEVLQEIFRDSDTWDEQLKNYILEEMYENAAEWNEEEISKEEFLGRLSVSGIYIYADNTVDVMVECDGMFTDHAIVVCLNEKKEFVRANLFG